MFLSPDLTHADWWIRTCTKLLQQVDTSLRFTVVKVEKTQHLVIENISEATLSKLFFLVNTDQNNNYGYLETLQVFVKDDYSRTAIPIPGFSTLANAIWNEADATGFVEGQKTQTAFLAPLNNPYTNEPLTVPQYVDWITAVIPWAPKTFGKEKIFTLILNPDSEAVGEIVENIAKYFLKDPDSVVAKRLAEGGVSESTIEELFKTKNFTMYVPPESAGYGAETNGYTRMYTGRSIDQIQKNPGSNTVSISSENFSTPEQKMNLFKDANNQIDYGKVAKVAAVAGGTAVVGGGATATGIEAKMGNIPPLKMS